MTPNDITLSPQQQQILDRLMAFVKQDRQRVFILKGYAGTGKTTLMRFFIEELEKTQKDFRLLSTTGRAAKILSNYTGHVASTIHGMVYKFKDFNKDISDIEAEITSVDDSGQLYLVFEATTLPKENRKGTVYIVDESSMISDIAEVDVTQAQFGSGRLLTDLLQYDDLKDSKFVFIGDPCQLPPILGNISPALSPEYFSSMFHLSAQEGVLTEILRQDNSIIAAGDYLRNLWEGAPVEESVYVGRTTWGPPFRMSRFDDVYVLSNLQELERLYIDSVREKGYNEAVFICNSNYKCYDTSSKVRQALGFSGSLQQGELLMVVQNQSTTGLMNGDMVEVLHVSPENQRVYKQIVTPERITTTLVFREVEVRELFTKRKVSTLMLETVLEGRMPNLDPGRQSGLFRDFIIRMKRKGIDNRKDVMEFEQAMRVDPFLNALRCNYGYAITCHKAQGGEWNTVFIQMPRNLTANPVKSKYQWFYTALTRAKESVYVSKDFFIQ